MAVDVACEIRNELQTKSLQGPQEGIKKLYNMTKYCADQFTPAVASVQPGNQSVAEALRCANAMIHLFCTLYSMN